MTMMTLATNISPNSPFDNQILHAAKSIGILSWTIMPERWYIISDAIVVNEIAEAFLAYTIEMSIQGEITATRDYILHAYNMYMGDNSYTPIYRIRELLKFYTSILLHY